MLNERRLHSTSTRRGIVSKWKILSITLLVSFTRKTTMKKHLSLTSALRGKCSQPSLVPHFLFDRLTFKCR
jgi:hypothetical protein